MFPLNNLARKGLRQSLLYSYEYNGDYHQERPASGWHCQYTV